jgi:hypothetical protein
MLALRRDFAAVVGLVSYGANLAEPYRLMGTYVGRILKGESAADLPVIVVPCRRTKLDREVLALDKTRFA